MFTINFAPQLVGPVPLATGCGDGGDGRKNQNSGDDEPRPSVPKFLLGWPLKWLVPRKPKKSKRYRISFPRKIPEISLKMECKKITPVPPKQLLHDL